MESFYLLLPFIFALLSSHFYLLFAFYLLLPFYLQEKKITYGNDARSYVIWIPKSLRAIKNNLFLLHIFDS